MAEYKIKKKWKEGEKTEKEFYNDEYVHANQLTSFAVESFCCKTLRENEK